MTERWNTADPLRSLPTTYCGRKATQWWADLYLWERLLNEHPETARIVELGTGTGGFSLYLAHQAAARGMTFATFDREVFFGDEVQPGFILADVFAEPERVWSLLNIPCVLFCDDGDKPRELAMFGSKLLPASLCVVHDWGDEATEANLPPNLTLTHHDLWQGGMCAVAVAS